MNTPTKLVLRIKGHEWREECVTKRVKVRSLKDASRFGWQTRREGKIISKRADFIVEIDVPEIIEEVIARAARTAGGTSRLLSSPGLLAMHSFVDF